MSGRDNKGAAVAAGALLGGLALGAAYLLSQTDTPVGEMLRKVASPPPRTSDAHGDAPPARHHHHHFETDDLAQREHLVRMLSDPARTAAMQPERVAREVLLPLALEAAAALRGRAATAGGPVFLGVDAAVVVADVGAGAGAFTLPLARALEEALRAPSPPGVVVATEPQPWLREALLLRAVEAGAKNILIAPGGRGDGGGAGIAAAEWDECASTGLVAPPPPPPSAAAPAGAAGAQRGVAGAPPLTLGVQAHVLLLANVYHHLPQRQRWLAATVAADVAAGGHVVLLEYQPVGASSGGGSAGGPPRAAAPAPQQGPGAHAHQGSDGFGGGGPPPWMRLERSTMLAEAAASGLQLEAAPAQLNDAGFHILVFRKC